MSAAPGRVAGLRGVPRRLTVVAEGRPAARRQTRQLGARGAARRYYCETDLDGKLNITSSGTNRINVQGDCVNEYRLVFERGWMIEKIKISRSSKFI